MAFTVQDDGGNVPGANSYATVEQFYAHHVDRGAAEPNEYPEADVQRALVLATDYIDSRYTFVGERQAANQTTEWPRYNAEDASGHLRLGLPDEVVEACCELALAELQSPGALFPSVSQDATGQSVKRTRTKVDVVETEVEYFDAAQRPPVFNRADWRLRRSGLVDASRRVVRG